MLSAVELHHKVQNYSYCVRNCSEFSSQCIFGCNNITGTCNQCQTDRDCSDQNLGMCNSSGQCSFCSRSSCPKGSFCNLGTQICNNGCLVSTNEGCREGEYCQVGPLNPLIGTCEKITTCAPGYTLQNHVCLSCLQDKSICKLPQICDPSSLSCVKMSEFPGSNLFCKYGTNSDGSCKQISCDRELAGDLIEVKCPLGGACVNFNYYEKKRDPLHFPFNQWCLIPLPGYSFANYKSSVPKRCYFLDNDDFNLDYCNLRR